MKKVTVLLICALLLAGALLLGWCLQEKEEPVIENAGVAQNAPAEQKFLTYQGQDYPLKHHVQTVLLIGTDSVDAYEEKTEGVRKFYNYNQADFLTLLVMDQDAKTVEILQMNRDTMTDVPWLDVRGKFGGTDFKQLCLAYNYGDGGMKSCKNTCDAVSRLLFDAPIEHYIQIPMSAIPVVNDLVGGVPVTIEEDLTMVDPALAVGKTVRLNGKQAETFVRSRMALEDDTNLARMKRQRQYLDSFQVEARRALNTDSKFVIKLLDKLGEYLQTDMTSQKLTDLITFLDNAKILPIRYPEGELKLGEAYYEFYADEASLWKMVKESYCEA